jgi:MFS transporter, Spinster family, sphingosine-1-phosphate transporter
MKGLRYRSYLLTVLLIILAFNYVDRLALALLLQDIKTDLQLSDSQLGLLTGLAFALFYAVMGIPLARWADRGNRVFIIAGTTLLWSVAVALCGVAASFVQLLLIRVVVAIGEAGCIPAAHSLIADYFDRAERPRAVAIYMMGGPLSMFIGYFVAGWLNELCGWRSTFVMLGWPGLALAALAWFTLKEPRRQPPAPVPNRPIDASPGLRDVAIALWSNHTFRHLLVFFSVVNFFGYGIAQWQAAFFVRSYGLASGALGSWFAGICGLGGILGAYLGGEWAARCARTNEALQLKAASLAYCSFGVISALIYLAPNHYLAFGFLALATVGVNVALGPLFGTIQTLVHERMRALAIAIIYLFINLIGMGLGPLAAGILSDAFRPWAGEESLRYALLVLSPGYLWGGWHLWRASRTVTRDLHPPEGGIDPSMIDVTIDSRM